jgi:hypothetical protein
MKLDPLLAASGAVKDVDVEDLPQYLRASAQAFLVAGGSLSLSDYAALSDESRAAFYDAGASLDEDRSYAIAAAIMECLSDSMDTVEDESTDEGAGKALTAMMGATRE